MPTLTKTNHYSNNLPGLPSTSLEDRVIAAFAERNGVSVEEARAHEAKGYQKALSNGWTPAQIIEAQTRWLSESDDSI